MSGHRKDRYRRGYRIGPDLPSRFPAVEFGKAKIHKDQVGKMTLSQRNAAHAIRRPNNFMPVAPQESSYYFLVRFIVFNNQNSCHRFIRSHQDFEWALGSPFYFPYAAIDPGIRMMNVEPCPGVLST